MFVHREEPRYRISRNRDVGQCAKIRVSHRMGGDPTKGHGVGNHGISGTMVSGTPALSRIKVS